MKKSALIIATFILLTVIIGSFPLYSANQLKRGTIVIANVPSPLKSFSFRKNGLVPLRRADFFIKSQSPEDYLFGKIFKKQSARCQYVIFPVFGNSMYAFRPGRDTGEMMEMILSGEAKGIEANTRKYDSNGLPFNELSELNGLVLIFRDRDSRYWRMDITDVIGDNVRFSYVRVCD
ncbi:MAG: hypothetical protein CVV64_09770 [Candidatus Wallbacteria bacterium HGW-Wallbacteria-1]|jgi:hypothetical protein|uniref:Uncharacterized protein n=1 Tax=Candidatus Wallbacteria bacterium HGW-Wallbacteria-1 TaxID=2013854 RepID=A0A2N1PQL0_9BACT|nr:MAG: hypothetical protein CVV64_09770 [Candidatus Wallbacteria bacterium HGW-Wallbacteria-1]